MKRTLFFLCTLLCANVLFAQTFWIGDLKYGITSIAPRQVAVSDANESITTANIPTRVMYGGEDYEVTSIGDMAFYNCTNLTSVNIPNGVTYIGGSAFADCTNLTSINIPNRVTAIGGDGTFANCTSLTSINIPNSVTSIGGFVFSGCSSLSSVTIGNNVTSIGNMAFYGCSSLTSITIPNGVTSIGIAMFSDCSSLSSVTIGNSVTSIGDDAFKNCSSLTSITIPNSVTSIGEQAFRGCSSLTSITIPNSVTSIGPGLFADCSSLTSVTLSNNITELPTVCYSYCLGFFRNCSNLISIDIPNSITSIGDQAFYGCSSLSSVTFLGETAPSISNNVFANTLSAKTLSYPCGSDYSSWQSATTWASVECFDLYLGNSLTSFPLTFEVISEQERTMKVSDCDNSANVADIPARVMYNGNTYSVTSIGDYAFNDCGSLTSVTIPNSVTSIGEFAFRFCNNLTSIDIPNSVTNIGRYAFADCTNLSSVNIPNSVTSIKGGTFEGCSGLASAIIGNNVTSIGDYAFKNCSSLTSFTIPNNVTFIGRDGFRGCSSLTSINIPNNVASIKDYTFDGCWSLSSVTIGNSVTSIGINAFRNCSSLSSVTIPNSVTSIGDWAFYNCSSLSSVTIGNGVTSIEDGAFKFCSSLSSITCFAVTAPSLSNGVFDETPNTKTLSYPCGSDYSSWESATDWESVECVVSLGNSLTASPLTFEVISEEDRTMKVSNCNASATDVDIPAKVMYNGNVYSVTSIGQWAFENCSQLTSVIIPNSITSFESFAFNGCSSLTSISIPNSVISIGDWAFYNCSSLTSVIFGNSVTSIGSNAFSHCSNLAFVTCLGETAPALSPNAFNGTLSDKTLTIPCGSDYSSWESATTWASVECPLDLENSLTSSPLTFEVISEEDRTMKVSACDASATDVDIPTTVIYNGTYYNVTVIGNGAFHACSSLSSVNIPNSVTSIGDEAFSDCSSLTSIDIPNRITYIGDMAFASCSSLTSITIPNSVTSIGNGAFGWCSSLSSVTCLAENAPSLGYDVFVNFSNITSNKTLTYPCRSDYSSWESATTWESVECVVSLGNNLTYFPLTFAVISDQERTMKVSNCDILATDADIPATVMYNGNAYSVTAIDIWAFHYCMNLTSVTIPNSVTSIGDMAFENCSSLTSITIPNSVTSIGATAFSSCESLTSVICLGENAPSLVSYVFRETPNTKTLTVPFNASGYTSNWGNTTWQKIYHKIDEGEVKTLSNTFEITDANKREVINDGVLRITQNGELINETDVNVGGIVEVETPLLAEGSWHFIGAPFTSGNERYKLESIIPGSRDVSVSMFDYDNMDWSNDWATIETEAGEGEGFFAWSFVDEIAAFTTYGDGAYSPNAHSDFEQYLYDYSITPAYNLNNDDVVVSKTLNDNSNGSGNWMALANPYTFKLDVESFVDDNVALAEIDMNDIQGRCIYRLNSASNTFAPVFEGAINLTEGFFVNFASAGENTATFKKSQRYNPISAKSSQRDFIKIVMIDGENETEVLFAQNEDAEQGYDILDANKMFSPSAVMEHYFVTDSVALVKEEVRSLPYYATMNVKSFGRKLVSFKAVNVPDGLEVSIIDGDEVISLNDGAVYNAEILSGENANRFKVLFGSSVGLEDMEDVEISFYPNPTNSKITFSQMIERIEVIDLTGRTIFTFSNASEINIESLPSGAYYLRLTNNDKAIMRKVIKE